MVKKEFTKVISQSGDDKLRLKIETKKGKVVDIFVQYEAKFYEKWHPIVRYDCSHGFLLLSPVIALIALIMRIQLGLQYCSGKYGRGLMPGRLPFTNFEQ